MVAGPRPEYTSALAELGKAGRMSVGTFHALTGVRSGPALGWLVGQGLAEVRPVTIHGAACGEVDGRLWELEITAHGRELLERRKLRP